MSNPHKIVPLGEDAKMHYMLYCEYCGHVAYHGNHTGSDNDDRQAKASGGCPVDPPAPVPIVENNYYTLPKPLDPET